MKPSIPITVFIIALASACATTPKPQSDELTVKEMKPVAPPAPPPPLETSTPVVAKAAEQCPTVRVHFAFDEALIRSEDLTLLDKVARCLRHNASQRLVIEGNADERGTEEYNLMLSSKRAASVERYLGDLGVSREQMDSVSYGDERPLCTSHEESCWAQNRRVALTPQ